MSTPEPPQTPRRPQNENSICYNLKVMAQHYRDILKILVWSQLIVGFFVMFAVVVLFLLVGPKLAQDGPTAFARQFQSVTGVLAGTVTSGVLEFLRRNRKKDLNEVHEDMKKYNCDAPQFNRKPE